MRDLTDAEIRARVFRATGRELDGLQVAHVRQGLALGIEFEQQMDTIAAAIGVSLWQREELAAALQTATLNRALDYRER